ncbi:MAG: TonB-dependent receptor [Candidatus Aminicenantes bacterium]|nr:TonB-dependent receptor [Candidatus Aminicenantes bacterium]
MKKIFMPLLILSLFTLPAAAQISQTGTLDGTVYDQDNQPLPGVNVSIKSAALISPSLEVVTNDRGHWRFPALPPGEYTVIFKLQGFRTLIREGIKVNVGVTTTLDVSLEQSAIEESITVTGAAPTVDIQRTSMTASITRDVLQNLPAARNLGAFFNMAPGVTSATVHGSSERDNTYNIDGVNITDPVTGTQAGTFGMDIMEELSVQTGGLPAEYGSVRGGVVNVVTRSGGNKFSGSVSFFYRNKDMQSTNTRGTIFEGQTGGFDYDYEPAANLGGPIIKDRIWFFANFSLQKTQEFSLGYPYDQPNQVPLDYKRPLPFIKFTIQATKKDRVVLAFNFSDYVRNHRGASSYRTVDTTWKQTTPIYTYNFQLTHFFNPNLYMNLKAGYMDYALNLMAKNDVVRVYDSRYYRYYGSYGYDDIYSRNRFQALTDGTYFLDEFLGRHEIKGGIEFEYSWDSRYRRHNRDAWGNGPFFYVRLSSGLPPDQIPMDLASLIDRVISEGISPTGTYPYMVHYQDFTRKDRKMVIGGFIQDTWSPFKRLTLNIGFRFDRQEGILPVQGQDRTPVEYPPGSGNIYDPRLNEQRKPYVWNTLAPRLGASFDLTGDAKTALKVSFCRYYIANIMQWFVTVNPNSFISWRTHYIINDGTDPNYPIDPNDPLTRLRPNPDRLMYNFSATASATMDPNLKSPYLDEFIIGIEREIITDTRFGVRYIHKWDRNLIEDVDLNRLNLNFYKALYSVKGHDAIFDPNCWYIYAPVTATDPWNNQTVTFWGRTDPGMTTPTSTFVTNPPGAKRDYDGVEVSLNKRFSNRWSAMISYVWQKSRGLIGTDFDDSWSGQSYFEDPNVHTFAMGNFGYERRNQFKVQAMWQGPWGIMISGYYRLLDGQRWTRRVRSSDLGVTLPQGTVTIYAEPRGSRSLPPLTILDLRVEKSFRLPGKFGQFGVFCDIFNVTNVAIPTGVHSISSSTTTVSGKLVSFGELTSLTDPRVFRLGARYSF